MSKLSTARFLKYALLLGPASHSSGGEWRRMKHVTCLRSVCLCLTTTTATINSGTVDVGWLCGNLRNINSCSAIRATRDLQKFNCLVSPLFWPRYIHLPYHFFSSIPLSGDKSAGHDVAGDKYREIHLFSGGIFQSISRPA